MAELMNNDYIENTMDVEESTDDLVVNLEKEQDDYEDDYINESDDLDIEEDDDDLDEFEDYDINNGLGVFHYKPNFTVSPSEFVVLLETYEDDESRANLLNSIIRRRYVPIAEKRAIIERMFAKSIVKDGANQYIDQFIYRYNMRIAIISMYTSLDLMRDLKDDALQINDEKFTVYDTLNAYGIVDAVVGMIDDDEIDEVNAIAKSIKDTWFNQTKSVESIVARVFNYMADAFGQFIAMGATEFVKAVADGTIPSEQAADLLDAVTHAFGEAAAKHNDDDNEKYRMMDYMDNNDFVEIEGTETLNVNEIQEDNEQAPLE